MNRIWQQGKQWGNKSVNKYKTSYPTKYPNNKPIFTNANHVCSSATRIADLDKRDWKCNQCGKYQGMSSKDFNAYFDNYLKEARLN